MAFFQYRYAFPVPRLPNLKHLELIVPADDHLASFFKASPFLQRFIPKVRSYILICKLNSFFIAIEPHKKIKLKYKVTGRLP